MKIGITGSLNFEEKNKLKEIIFELKNKFKNNLLIATRSNKFGVEKHTKQICKWEFNIPYTEFPPYFMEWNPDCELNGTIKYIYNQNYHPKYLHMRDNSFINFCDIILVFIDETDKNIKKFIKKLEKKNKKYIKVF